MSESQPSAPKGSVGGRAGLVTVSQGLSSVTNLFVVLWAAHTISAIDFGKFSLLLLVYAFVMGPVHAVVSMRVVVHPHDADQRPRDVLGNAFALGLGGGAACALVGVAQIIAGWDLGPALVTLGLFLPFLVLHDVGRWVGVARSQPVRAVTLDALWLAAMVGGAILVHSTLPATLLNLTAVWAGSGALASLLLLAQYGFLRPREIFSTWLRERWHASWRLLVGNVTATGSALAGASLIAIVSTPLAVAAVRGAILLGRPTSAIQNAVASSMAADVAREQSDDRSLMRHQQRTMLVSAGVALINLVVLFAIPDSLGRAVLGNVWPVLAPLLLPVSLWLIAAAAQAGAPPALIGRRQFQTAMVVQIVGGLLNVTALVGGAVIAGVEGAVWGLVVGQLAMAACWWFGLVRYLRRRRVPEPTQAASDE